VSAQQAIHDRKDTQDLIAYLGHVVSPLSAETYTDIAGGAVVVDCLGKIIDVGPWSLLKSKYANIEVKDFGQALLLPGFVDMHSHLPQLPQTGRSGKTLLGWLKEYVFPAEARFADPLHAQKVANWFFDELAANGTTTACVFTTIHANSTDIAFKTASAKGNRVIMGKVLMDCNSPPELTENYQESVNQSDELCKRWHGYDGNRLQYAFTPRFAVSSTSNLLSACGKAWQQNPGSYLQTHISETEEEVAKVRQLFPTASSYLDVYAGYGLVGKKSVLAHAVHLDDKDMQSIAKASCGVAHCPSSNFFLKSGAFPFAKMKKADVLFGLGCDVAGGPEVSMLSVMKDTAYMQTHHWISPAELFYLATLGGARALQMQDTIGTLTPGKEADFVVVNPNYKESVPRDILRRPTDDILSSMIYLGDDRMVAATYVRGRAIYQSNRLLVDVKEGLPLKASK
jgi:guanine deaminase